MSGVTGVERGEMVWLVALEIGLVVGECFVSGPVWVGGESLPKI